MVLLPPGMSSTTTGTDVVQCMLGMMAVHTECVIYLHLGRELPFSHSWDKPLSHTSVKKHRVVGRGRAR